LTGRVLIVLGIEVVRVEIVVVVVVVGVGVVKLLWLLVIAGIVRETLVVYVVESHRIHFGIILKKIKKALNLIIL